MINNSNTNNIFNLNSKPEHEVNKSNINSEKQHENNINNEDFPGKFKNNETNIKNQYSTFNLDTILENDNFSENVKNKEDISENPSLKL